MNLGESLGLLVHTTFVIRPRPCSGETEVPPEVTVEPMSGHVVMRSG